MRDKQRLRISVRDKSGRLIDFQLIAHERIFRGELALNIYPLDLRLPYYEFQIVESELGPERTVGVFDKNGGLYVPVTENLVTDDRAEQVLTTWAVLEVCLTMSVERIEMFLQKNPAEQKVFLASVKSNTGVNCTEFVFF